MHLHLINLGASFAPVLSVWSVARPKERKRPQPLTENSVMEACLGKGTSLIHHNPFCVLAMILQIVTGSLRASALSLVMVFNCGGTEAGSA